MKKIFEGELAWINPKFLVTEEKFDKVESFFLALGVVFNDLRGLLLFEEMLKDVYEKPTDQDVTVQAGSYGGVLVQIQKLIASVISEFFIFLKKNFDVLNTPEYKEVLSKIPKSKKQYWDGIIDAANNKLPAVESLLKAVIFVRSNISFHYDHSGKILRNAYISRFFGEDDNPKKKKAFYSLGGTIASTRFYFSDAAVEEALFNAAGKKNKAKSKDDLTLRQYYNEINDTIRVMSITISSLVDIYIKSRRNRPH